MCEKPPQRLYKYQPSWVFQRLVRRRVSPVGGGCHRPRLVHRLVASLALLVVRCDRGIGVWLKPHSTIDSLAIFVGTGGQPGRDVDGIRMISLYSCRGGDYPPLWAVSRTTDGPVEQPFKYGITPPGWSVDVSAHRLEKFHCYGVSATGGGYFGGVAFTFDDSGLAHNNRTPDR